MGRKKTNQRILEEACKNAAVIEDTMREIDALIPPENKAEAEMLWMALQHRMVYQDYLYDCHKPITFGHKVELSYEKYCDLMRQSGLW
jgi:hypothetical protein